MDTRTAPGQVTQLLRLAHERRVGMSPTELVHEAFLRLVHQDQPEWANRAYSCSIAARLMRQILVDFVRAATAWLRAWLTSPEQS